jgi:hypothetical protein
VISPEAAADPHRKHSQNKNDVEAVHLRLDETNEVVRKTNTKVDALTIHVIGLGQQTAGLTKQITGLTDQTRIRE